LADERFLDCPPSREPKPPATAPQKSSIAIRSDSQGLVLSREA
jgi:hypothetical protein